MRKMRSDLKLTGMREGRVQNERLRAELSRALMNDERILEAKQVNTNNNNNNNKVEQIEQVKHVRINFVFFTLYFN